MLFIFHFDQLLPEESHLVAQLVYLGLVLFSLDGFEAVVAERVAQV